MQTKPTEKRYSVLVDDAQSGPGPMTFREAANYVAAVTRDTKEHTPEQVIQTRAKFLSVFENGFEVVRLYSTGRSEIYDYDQDPETLGEHRYIQQAIHNALEED